MTDKKILPWSYWTWEDPAGYNDSSIWQVIPGEPTSDNTCQYTDGDDLLVKLIWQEGRRSRDYIVGEQQVVSWRSSYLLTQPHWRRILKEDVPLVMLRALNND